MGSTGGQRPHHVVLFPFMAQGHLIPFLSLAKLIHRRHHGRFTITLVNTPSNIRDLRSSVPPDAGIFLRDLPFSGADHGLPSGAENTDALHYDDIEKLFIASEALQPHFEQLLLDITAREGRPPLCVVGDFLAGWTAVVAGKLGIFHATFCTCSAYGTATYFAMWLHLPHLRTDPTADDFPVPGLPETFRLQRSQLSRNIRETDGTDGWAVFLRKQLSMCSVHSRFVLCNTAETVETTGMELLRNVMAPLPVLAIGPVLPEVRRDSGARTGRRAEVPLESLLEWLGRHPPASVLYVSFGSQNTIGVAQMLQLAAGLEASGHPFVWVIRPPLGFDLNSTFRTEEWLPGGFDTRVRESGRGLLVNNWAPQLEILSHRSTGGFLSHCGWNSVLESLENGVPLIGWPMAAEQFYNAKMLVEELGVCEELARGATAGVKREEVETAIRQVMGAERGVEMRRRAVECARKIRAALGEEGEKGGPSAQALDDFLADAAKLSK